MKKFIAIITMFFILSGSVLVGVRVSAAGEINKGNQQKDIYEKVKNIQFSETFAQDEKEYIVYYYQKKCGYCEMIKDDFQKFASKMNYKGVYAVQMDIPQNREGWYDMKKHHEKYDIEIGELDNEGKVKYYNGESAEKYTSGALKTEDGETIKYKILIADKNKYVSYMEKANKNAKLNKVYAVDFTKRLYRDPAAFRVGGTPTAIVVRDGKMLECTNGVEEIRKLFSVYSSDDYVKSN